MSLSEARQWTLSALLEGVCDVPEAYERMIEDITLDSRKVGPGCAFFAVPGSDHDGRDFIDDAFARGAVAVVAESGAGESSQHVIEVPALRHRLGMIADRFHGSPSAVLDVIGVTGTNGKTTCVWLLAAALNELDGPCGLIGTLGWGIPGAIEPAALTTPDVFTLHERLRRLREAGARRVCMEVSSHALDQGRVDAVRFDVAVFTNLSRDHLDYHGDMDAYGEAKLRLFRRRGLRAAVVNADDAFAAKVLDASDASELWRYGVRGDIRPRDVQPDDDGVSFTVDLPEPHHPRSLAIRSRLFGRFNVENLLAVIAALLATGQRAEVVAPTVAGLDAAPGRMEVFSAPQAARVVVDYAHTPDALEKALLAAREHCRGRLWCVFGCGGDRDRGKRPLMGEVVDRLVDEAIVTDDNPRSEAPEAIAAQILAGMRRAPRVIHDRQAAIATAVAEAAADDLIIVAGKGHETTQTTGARVIALSDRALARKALGLAA